MMLPEERALLLAVAKRLAYGTHPENRPGLEQAIRDFESVERCVFDGNPMPCPHHSSWTVEDVRRTDAKKR